MPIFDFKCQCGEIIRDSWQPTSTDVENCPKCGRTMERLWDMGVGEMRHMKIDGGTPLFHEKAMKPFDGGRRPNG